MQPIVVVARLLHVGLGVFWAGTIFFVFFLLEPSVRASGPAGGSVMQALDKKGMFKILPIAALFTILSGAYLYWHDSGGLMGSWFSTAFGLAMTVGAVTAIVAYIIGLSLMRPAQIQIGTLASSLPGQESDVERARVAGEIESLKERSRSYLRSIALLLLVTVVAMAVARYM